MTLALFLQYSASVTTLLQMWLYGNRSLAGPIWGLISSGFWWGVMIENGELWGLWPFNTIMLFVNVRNLIKWSADGHARGTP